MSDRITLPPPVQTTPVFRVLGFLHNNPEPHYNPFIPGTKRWIKENEKIQLRIIADLKRANKQPRN